MSDSDSTSLEDRHRLRMQRKKAVVDQSIAAAQEDRGLVLIHTGTGRGKSTSAFGLIARMLGHGKTAGVVQFVKGRTDTGEEAFFCEHPRVQWYVMGRGFTWETQDLLRDREAARKAWERACELMRDPNCALVVLDEVTYTIKYGHITVEEVLEALSARPPMQHVVITGRGAQPALIEMADTVSDMSMVKHAFQAGVRAQPGVEW